MTPALLDMFHCFNHNSSLWNCGAMFHNIIFFFLMCLYLTNYVHTSEKKIICFPVKILSDSSRHLVCSWGAQSFLVNRELAFHQLLIFIRIKILSRIFSSYGILSQHVSVINMLFLVKNDTNFPVSYQSKLFLNLLQSDTDLQN